MKLSTLFLISVFSLSLSIVFAQKKTFENVLRVRNQSSGVLLNGNEVEGYYFFYALGKAKKGKRSYLLSILDENLNEVNSQVIEESKRTSLIEGGFNGKEIILKLYDYNDRKGIYLSYNLKGEPINRREIGIKNRNELLKFGANGELNSGRNLYNASNVGFINYSLHNKTKGYKVDFFSSENENGDWEYTSEQKSIQSIGNLLVTPEIILNVVLKKPNITSNKISFYIQGMDTKTGNVIFEKEIKDKYVHQPLTAYKDSKTGLMNVLGLYYSKDTKKVGKKPGIGLFQYSVNKQGDVSNKKYLLWSGNISKFLPVSLKGKIGGSYVYFHDIVQRPDGSVIAIGEQYKKTASAGGIAANVLLGGGSASTTKIVIEDLLLFEFTPDFEVKNVEVVEKTKSNFALPAGFDFVNVHLLANFVKASGGFDYAFNQENQKDDVVSIGYLDFEKTAGEKRKWIFGAITVGDEGYSKDKFTLKRSSKEKISIFRAKEGYIGLFEYNKKEKTAEIRLERINY